MQVQSALLAYLRCPDQLLRRSLILALPLRVALSLSQSALSLLLFFCCFETRFCFSACFVFVFAAVSRTVRRHIIMYTIAIMAVVVIAVVVVAVIVIVVAAALCENQKTAHQLFFLSAAHLKFANVAF